MSWTGASWNAAAAVCAVQWAGRLEETGEVWQGQRPERNDGKRLEWTSGSASSQSIPHVNRNDGRSVCQKCGLHVCASRRAQCGLIRDATCVTAANKVLSTRLISLESSVV